MYNGYEYTIGTDKQIANAANALRTIDPRGASAAILAAANESDGNEYDFFRLLTQAVSVALATQPRHEMVGLLVEMTNENEALKAIIATDCDECECTCLPLDGGLGAQTCRACKRAAGKSEIPY